MKISQEKNIKIEINKSREKTLQNEQNWEKLKKIEKSKKMVKIDYLDTIEKLDKNVKVKEYGQFWTI